MEARISECLGPVAAQAESRTAADRARHAFEILIFSRLPFLCEEAGWRRERREGPLHGKIKAHDALAVHDGVGLVHVRAFDGEGGVGGLEDAALPDGSKLDELRAAVDRALIARVEHDGCRLDD